MDTGLVYKLIKRRTQAEEHALSLALFEMTSARSIVMKQRQLDAYVDYLRLPGTGHVLMHNATDLRLC